MSSARNLQDLAMRKGTVLLDFPEPMLFVAPREVLTASTLSEVPELLQAIDHFSSQGLYIAGYLAFEAGYALDPAMGSLPVASENSTPLAWFGVYEQPHDLPPGRDARVASEVVNPQLQISESAYIDCVQRVRRHIEDGDCYQINFTDRVTFGYQGEPFALYRTLLEAQPVPYAAFLNTGGEYIASLSPELLFRREASTITMRPMKGTAARGRTTAEDRLLAEQLKTSEKERAENIMIVDLVRNDLGRICQIGSVRVASLYDVERFSTLHQLTSTVEGHVQPNVRPSDILRAIFPSGSVTGAPKIKTMQLIRALERSPRGVYTGAIGYFHRDRAVMNVPIRTVVLGHGRGSMGVGSGITWDSDPAAEFNECRLKARFLTAKRPEFELIESLRFDREYHALEAHLARLADSASYFGFRLDLSEVRDALLHAAAGLASPSKVRLTLTRNGRVNINASPLARQFGRVGLCTIATDASDRMFFHKTTARELYNRAQAWAAQHQLDDVLFFNGEGQLTEGSIHNVFLRFGSKLLTPALTCGLLPGVARAELLSSDKTAKEAILTIDDLRAADEILLCNSVRGKYKVTLTDAVLVGEIIGRSPASAAGASLP